MPAGRPAKEAESIMIVAWDNTYEEEAVALWNGEAVRDGYKEMSGERFRSSMTGHPSFDAGTAFVLLEEGRVEGFAVGCAGDDLPLGDVAGYITCVVVRSGPEADAARSRLLDELERRFRELGRKQAEVLFFNPMRLPWYIPDTPGHEHNNAPGVPAGSSLHRLLLERGYAERALQKAMYLPLADFSVPDEIRAKEERAASAGYRVERLDAARHSGLAEMLEALGNPLWKQEIASAAASGVPVLLAAREGRAAGFAGPVIREDSGRGYFAGIGVEPSHEGHGLGTILFFRLCEAFRSAGAEYMSLYTGSGNPALRIYEKAGFRTVKEFAVMRKEL